MQWSEMPPLLQLHLWSALAALASGPFVIYRRRRDALHRVLGYAWVLLLGLAALSSLGLKAAVLHVGLGFGPIHLLALWVIVQLALGLREARIGRIAAHGHRMAALYWQGLAGAGLFTLLPGRILNDLLFGFRPDVGIWLIAGFGAGVLVMALRLESHVPPPPPRHS